MHFGINSIFDLAIGRIMSPIGTGLFVGAGAAKVRVEIAVKALEPRDLLLMLVT